MKRVYLTSGTNKKADPTDEINYYLADNGMAILIETFLNMSGRMYVVIDNEEHAKKYNSLIGHNDGFIRSFDNLKAAKAFVKEV